MYRFCTASGAAEAVKVMKTLARAPSSNGRSLLFVLCSALFTAVPVCAGESPAYLPSMQNRVEASEIVCFATILSTTATSNTVEVGDELAAQWTALASLDQVFKGALSSHVIHFDYYRLVPRTADHSGPPTAYFETAFAMRFSSRFGIPICTMRSPFTRWRYSSPRNLPRRLSATARRCPR
jgi:hypothetical protein